MPSPFELCCDPHEVVTQIVVRGELDRPAARLLDDALASARLSGAKMIVVDLRALESIDPAALWRLRCADVDCRASAVRLRLLIPGRAGHEAVQDAFRAAGLGAQVRFTREPHLSALTGGRP